VVCKLACHHIAVLDRRWNYRRIHPGNVSHGENESLLFLPKLPARDWPAVKGDCAMTLRPDKSPSQHRLALVVPLLLAPVNPT
jgi:hypothetical protein